MSGFEYKGKKLYPVQDAYISDCGKFYQAQAQSIENDITYDYKMIWKIKEGHDITDLTDESNACNWDEFEVIELGQAL